MCDTDNNGIRKKDLDDSGFVFDMSGQDASMSAHVNLLDLSDDVLLYILRFCAPRDLKALCFSCIRLGSLVRERTLWRYVDARSEPCSRARLKWLLDNTLHSDTHVLMLTGYARETEGCMGLINVTRLEAENEVYGYGIKDDPAGGRSTLCDSIRELPLPLLDTMERHPARYFISAQRTPLPRHRCFPSWPDDGVEGRLGPQRCSGPHYTLSVALLQQLSTTCPQLHTLGLDYCNIDCTSTTLTNFPRTLKKLSLRGTKCYNMTFDKSILFKIQHHLPVLESLDVSECEWMDPATLLPLSKMAALEELIMQDCHKLAEFVAYASLTARYGFRVLKSLDLRGSPVGDSEVAALGWLPQLEKLWLSARRNKRDYPHAHYTTDERIQHVQLHEWETADSDDFKPKSNPDTSVEDTEHGMGDVIPSSAIINDEPASKDIINDDPASKNERSQPKDTKGNIDNTDENDKKDAKRKPDNTTEDDSDSNGEPSCKRSRTGVEIPCDKNTVTENVLPVVRNESGFFIFDETAEPSNVNNANKHNAEENYANEHSANENYANKRNANARNAIVNNANDHNANENNANENRGNNNENNAIPNNEPSNDGNNLLPPNFEFNLLNPMGNMDVSKVEIDLNVDNLENLRENLRNANENILRRFRENLENQRDNANQEYRRGNDNRENVANEGNERDDSDCIVDCIKIDQLIDVSEGSGGRQNEVIVIASSTRPKSEPSTSNQRPAGCVHTRHSQRPAGCVHTRHSPKPFYYTLNSERDDNRNVNDVKMDENPQANVDNDEQKGGDEKIDDNKIDNEKIDDAKPGPSGNVQVNDGASTSKDGQNADKDKYVLFRKNKDPEYINCSPDNVQRREPLPPVQYQVEPRHHVLYVGIGPQLNTYRFPRDSSELLRHLTYPPTHVDSTGLVTDFAMRRFGRADGEDVNIIHIGPDGPVLVGQAPGSRPDRSSLRFLSATGYRHITNRSLMHLATSAPNLEFIDFSGTSVTENGVENFKSLRSDCDVVFSPYHKDEENHEN